ncbi:MAG: SRPBCC family protein, partial [bacterium]|nr:SRPBCC family protein [bacterium]
DGSTSWCLGPYPIEGGGTRMVSRWRPKFEMTPATFLMSALAEPGTFIMEQKMLRTIRDRVEHP